LAVLGVCFLAVGANASYSATPENGKEYRLLDRAQPTDAGKKLKFLNFCLLLPTLFCA